MTEHTVYRNGANLSQELVKEALAHFYKEHGVKPAGVVCHPTTEDQVGQWVAVLWPGLPVQTVGGCLANEVRLVKPEPKRPAQMKMEV